MHHHVPCTRPNLASLSDLPSHIMNWTGGSLQRTKHAKGGISHQQKAYFARARTHPEHEIRIPVTHFRPSWLQNTASLTSVDAHALFEGDSVKIARHPVRQDEEIRDLEGKDSDVVRWSHDPPALLESPRQRSILQETNMENSRISS